MHTIAPEARQERTAQFLRLAALGLNGSQIQARTGYSRTVIYRELLAAGFSLGRVNQARRQDWLVSRVSHQAVQRGPDAVQGA